LLKDSSCLGSDYATITEKVWYRLMYVDPNLFVKDINNNINITAEYDGSACGGDGDAKPDNDPYPLIIHIENKNIPRFYNWYCGDTHYHSSYTDTKFLASIRREFGGPIDATIAMIDAISLDWITITDHSNSFSRHKNDDLGLTWEDFKIFKYI